MDVRGVKSSLAAVLARPMRLWPDQPDAGTVAVVMDFPICRDDHIDVVIREEIRCAMWAVHDSQGPGVGEVGYWEKRVGR
mgnify:CR=1 FL=1